MPRLPDNPTVGEVRRFLEAVEVPIDDQRVSKINKGMTKRLVWEVLSGADEGRPDDEPFIPSSWQPLTVTRWTLVLKNINKEFGDRKGRGTDA